MSKQYGFFVDTSRCIKCWACEVACKQWNGIEAGNGIRRRVVVETDEGTFPEVNRTFVTTACNHCEEPACVKACPTGSITKREEDGLVVVNKETCIGCQTCASACPFGIPQYEPVEGKMDKCDGCITCGQTDDDEPVPHCVATCPTKALRYGPLDEMAELAEAKSGHRIDGETLPAVYLA